jgi:hypothetical protein
MTERFNEILDKLDKKACLKQKVYRESLEVFTRFRDKAAKIAEELAPKILEKDPSVEILFNDMGQFEFHLKFSGDTLVFMMHTNIFTFPPDHEISKYSYINLYEERGYFGMIQIYNFLSDSLKYQRQTDVGYLIARIFTNKDKHIFVDGRRQLDYLYQDPEKNIISDEIIENIIEQSMLYCLDFDLYAPPMDMLRAINIEQKNFINNPSGLPTGKRVGFVISDHHES